MHASHGAHVTLRHLNPLRYSLKIVVPTSVPVWVPVPVLTKHLPGPLRMGTYAFSLWVRSSPAAAKVYFTYGPPANSTEVTPALILLGTAHRGWTKVTTTFRVPAERANAAGAPTAVLPQLMVAPALHPSCGGCSNLGAAVWVDDVAIEPEAASAYSDRQT